MAIVKEQVNGEKLIYQGNEADIWKSYQFPKRKHSTMGRIKLLTQANIKHMKR